MRKAPLKGLPLLKRARVYTLKPGDIVVLEVPGILSDDTAARMAEFGTRAFYPAKAVVLEGGTTVRVLRCPDPRLQGL